MRTRLLLPRSALARVLTLCAVVGATLAVSGCVTKKSFDEVSDERDRLATERRKLLVQVEQLGAANTSLSFEREKLLDEVEDFRIQTGELETNVQRLARTEAELSESLQTKEALLAEREAEIERMRGTYDGLITDLEEEVASGQIQIDQLRSGLNLNLSQDILFGSGSARLNPAGEAVLRKVAGRLAELAYTVEVIGHTDDVPIGSRFPSNWELAAARASSVVRLLAGAGVDPSQLVAVSRGEFEPVASNDTAEGRARNRRIEIRLAPNEAPAEKPSTAPLQPEGEPADLVP